MVVREMDEEQLEVTVSKQIKIGTQQSQINSLVAASFPKTFLHFP